jgi:polyisoprenoid-binding protein YceI
MSGLSIPEGVWNIDPVRSEIGFTVKAMWGLQTVRGVFGAYDGALTVKADGAGGALEINAGSLDTGHDKRDRHLRSPDFFDVERHPRIVFTATDVTAREGLLTVTGVLAIGAARLPLELPVNVERTPERALRLQAETTVSRQSAGLTWNKLGSIGRDAKLHARLTLKQRDGGGRPPVARP